ncbi:Uu.00g125340.m01.CDS01 [Anthostomella pinea]|uniref:Uu.00g125340.m01.CDS01 n=1 Tax=Anthostomella pinea TaxID=933095 RepID=A0AAI8VIP9_9PEZI|nr:Uu.00g125340.m01.CDS01 [Anthostomella pinea]
MHLLQCISLGLLLVESSVQLSVRRGIEPEQNGHISKRAWDDVNKCMEEQCLNGVAFILIRDTLMTTPGGKKELGEKNAQCKKWCQKNWNTIGSDDQKWADILLNEMKEPDTAQSGAPVTSAYTPSSAASGPGGRYCNVRYSKAYTKANIKFSKTYTKADVKWSTWASRYNEATTHCEESSSEESDNEEAQEQAQQAQEAAQKKGKKKGKKTGKGDNKKDWQMVMRGDGTIGWKNKMTGVIQWSG